MRIGCGYVKPLYLQPMYQQKIAYGKKGYPFNATSRTYANGTCPVTERMHYSELFTHELMRPPMTRKDLDDVVSAFTKVWEQKKEIV